jgi:cell division septation protein DedD
MILRTRLARLGGPGRRHTDEDIVDTLRAAQEEGADVAAVCAARGVTVPTYCVWKAKYGSLTLADLRTRRRHETMRAGLQRAMAAAALVIAASGVGLWLTAGASDAGPTNAGIPQAVPAAAPALPDVLPPAPAPATSGTMTSADTALTVATADALRAIAAPERQEEPAAAEAYAVQVAAFPEAQQARRLVEQLVLTGHAAHVLAATISGVEVFRVRVGPFASRQAAEATLGQLEREGYRGPWIAR